MRTVTVEYNVCKYHELSEDAKQKVKDWYLNDPCRVYLFEEDIACDLSCLFREDHDMKVQFDLGYCQGDGLNIYGSVAVIDVINYIKNHRTNVLTAEEAEEIMRYAEYTDGIELPRNSRYAYCVANYISFVWEWVDQLEYYEVENVNIELIKKFERIVKSIFTDLCAEYEKWGYEYFYEISDEELGELCEANEWEFYEDGKLY